MSKATIWATVAHWPQDQVLDLVGAFDRIVEDTEEPAYMTQAAAVMSSDLTSALGRSLADKRSSERMADRVSTPATPDGGT